VVSEVVAAIVAGAVAAGAAGSAAAGEDSAGGTGTTPPGFPDGNAPVEYIRELPGTGRHRLPHRWNHPEWKKNWNCSNGKPGISRVP